MNKALIALMATAVLAIGFVAVQQVNARDASSASKYDLATNGAFANGSSNVAGVWVISAEGNITYCAAANAGSGTSKATIVCSDPTPISSTQASHAR